ncbi:hypothetical protein KNP414_01282 [Paenibacillus mucilaginosus KNP414]|uniref:Uncharacterized protein n=1 Tax=Paenibacillus mucilaginosus (strain KNP414) TaxID=1036673 RepID=F8FHE5_PAEMK|nr:hypothetical protein KNP414_01282 [Paenibacillus mucilaginosus KNP414]
MVCSLLSRSAKPPVYSALLPFPRSSRCSRFSFCSSRVGKAARFPLVRSAKPPAVLHFVLLFPGRQSRLQFCSSFCSSRVGRAARCFALQSVPEGEPLCASKVASPSHMPCAA